VRVLSCEIVARQTCDCRSTQRGSTDSTGVLRGHEGGPLVVGNIMYVHGPFPNPVFALEGKILWKYEPKQDPDIIPIMCCDTVNRRKS
jgi:glucose dehydrogenase